MNCHERPNNSCPVKNWCVCQWAFASYVASAGGCDHIQHVQCDAINMHALIAYQNSSEKKNLDALRCIEMKCGLIGEAKVSAVL